MNKTLSSLLFLSILGTMNTIGAWTHNYVNETPFEVEWEGIYPGCSTEKIKKKPNERHGPGKGACSIKSLNAKVFTKDKMPAWVPKSLTESEEKRITTDVKIVDAKPYNGPYSGGATFVIKGPYVDGKEIYTRKDGWVKGAPSNTAGLGEYRITKN